MAQVKVGGGVGQNSALLMAGLEVLKAFMKD